MAIGAVAAAALTFGAATALAAVQTGTYTGITSQVNPAGQHAPVKLVVATTKDVKLFKYTFHATCQHHAAGYANTFGAHNMAISNKKFQDVGVFTFAGPQGMTAHAKVAIAGGFTTAGHALGSFGVKITFTKNGSVQDKCTTGIVNWHAQK
jgi:hypothetical protein